MHGEKASVQGISSLTWLDGKWHEGDPPLYTANSLAAWLSSTVFDGARSFDGVAPDLDRHCERLNNSARSFGLEPLLTVAEMTKLAWEGIRRFPKETQLYVRPMYWGDSGFIVPDPGSTRFALVLTEMTMPEPKGFAACLSTYRRPAPNTAPTDAKASCLYPNGARALVEARSRGFDNGVILDLLGNVAEFITSNLFIVKDGVTVTPIPNGTFLNGITRQRVIQLLREDGREVVERVVTWPEVMDADEIFSTGNYAKVTPVSRIEDRNLQPGPVYERARKLYFDFAREQTG